MLHLSIWVVVANKQVKKPVQDEDHVEDEEYLLVRLGEHLLLAHDDRGVNNPDDEDHLGQAVPDQVPVVTRRNDEPGHLEGVALLFLFIVMLVALALLVHEHDLGLTDFTHHSDQLFLSSNDAPQLSGSVYLYLFLISLI
jgi:hypothetical protein